ncbi:MAG: glycosyltransferase family 2 protein [Bacteroidales bacterium]|nr:glycosyltransferase family 2 protein [Bacteroidales bacterium]
MSETANGQNEMSVYSLSVVVPCRNEAGHISACLDSLLQSSYKKGPMEIIVVDGMSSDGTRDILDKYVSRHPCIRVIGNPGGITPVALNTGIRNASGRLIMIAGAHSSFPENYIPDIVDKMDELNADVAGGKIITAPGASTPVSMAIARILSNSVGVGDSKFRTGASGPMPVDTVPFGIFRSEVFRDAGLYDERLVRNHDIELSKRIKRAGKSIFLVPSVHCTYYARETFRRLADNNFRNGYWNILTLYITGLFSSLSLRHYVPLAFLLSLCAPFFLAFIHPAFNYIPPVLFIVYNMLIFNISYRLKSDKVRFYLLVRGFFVLHFSYGAGSLTGLFRLDKLFLKS